MELEKGEQVTIIRKLRLRLGQAHRIAQAAETCATEGCSERSRRLLGEVEELTRDAGHLVQAAVIVTFPDIDMETPKDRP